MGLAVTIQLVLILPSRLASIQSGFESFFDEPLSHPLHGGGADVQALGNRGIAPTRSPLALVGLQENPGVCELSRRGFAPREHGTQHLAFFFGQRDDILLPHDRSPCLGYIYLIDKKT
jgi:hypothetical protein